jgi:hypothetical protein
MPASPFNSVVRLWYGDPGVQSEKTPTPNVYWARIAGSVRRNIAQSWPDLTLIRRPDQETHSDAIPVTH